MPTNRNAPLPPAILVEDRQAIKAIKEMANYTPHRPEHTVEALVSLDASLAQAADDLLRLQIATDAVRIRFIELSWELHNSVVGARDEVAVLFGPDSSALNAVGRKRASERKRPVRRTPSA
jgi:hypothetical protein